MVTFYMSWFARLYQPSDAGWICVRTPDNKSIDKQDAFFWFALEVIGRELNAMRAEELAKMTGG